MTEPRDPSAGALMKRIALAWLLLLPQSLLAQTIYRHVDENGIVAFSDVATEGAESMTLEVIAPRENAFGSGAIPSGAVLAAAPPRRAPGCHAAPRGHHPHYWGA